MVVAIIDVLDFFKDTVVDLQMASQTAGYASNARGLIVQVVRFHIYAAVAVLVLLVAGFALVPYALDAVEESASYVQALKSSALEGLSLTDIPPIDTSFTLPAKGESVTEEQLAYMKYYGFIKFNGALSEKEVEGIRAEKFRIEEELIDQGRVELNGVPLFRGTGAMNRSIHPNPIFLIPLAIDP